MQRRGERLCVYKGAPCFPLPGCACMCISVCVFHFLCCPACGQDPGGAACARGGPADHHSGGGAEET